MVARYGFTLLELSLVLVIIGLLVGGVLVGRTLIEAANVQRILGEFNNYDIANTRYKDRYRAIAGDHANAYQFFGDGCGDDDIAWTTGCNGNGDSSLDDRPVIGGNPYEIGENPKYFKHLALSGLTQGAYNADCGTQFNFQCALQAGVNSPLSRVGGMMWGIDTEPCEECSHMRGQKILFLVSAMPGGSDPIVPFNSDTDGQSIKKEWIYSMERKVDDGDPHHGRVLSTGAAPGYCAQYTSFDDRRLCTPYFKLTVQN